MRDILKAPAAYWQLSIEQHAEICNGCGARDGIDVPDTVYLLSIKRACNIHDYMYQVGTTAEEKIEADRTFLANMNAIIKKESVFFLKGPRMVRAREYYLAVKYFGHDAFYNAKPIPTQKETR